jgi:signal transduction histidine kinase
VILLQLNSKILFIIGITVAMLLVIAGFSVYILILFQKRKTRLLQQQQAIRENYEKEILKTQIEIREQAMNDVGRELHDHISQVMTLIKLNMSMLAGKGLDIENEKRLADTKDMMKEAINDVRLLSKTLNSDLILQIGLVESIKHELDRINRLNIIACRLEVEGKEHTIQPNSAFVIFRIVQENLHNILKHAHCRNVLTKLNYTPDGVILIQQDDGVGFDLERSNSKYGSGLINMRRRAAIINAELKFESELNKGTKLTLKVDNGQVAV